MTASDVGKVDVQHLCKLAGVSRASYYRRFETRAPREADVELTSQIQLLSLRHRFYGYRRIAALLRRSGLIVNAKRVQRLVHEATAQSSRGACTDLRALYHSANSVFSSMNRGTSAASICGHDPRWLSFHPW
jgi:AcrR family transcriptional regulator